MHPERKVLVAGNWKMHHTHLEAIRLVQTLGFALERMDLRHVEVSAHPPFTSIRSVQTVVDGDDLPISLGAQTCHFEDLGAFTGEVSPVMLAKLGVRYVITGHSERRAMCGETDEIVQAKLKAVYRNHMVPVLCVGESGAERARGLTEERLSEQLGSALAVLNAEQIASLVVAYEPIWAIGTGENASLKDAEEAASFIRSVVAGNAGAAAAGSVRVLYGGSATDENAAELLGGDDVDGLLVGGASLDPDRFARIVERAVEAVKERGSASS